MSTSASVVRDLKTAVIDELINDDEIINALDCPYRNDENWSPLFARNGRVLDELNRVRKNAEDKQYAPIIYDYMKHPEVVEDVESFIVVLVNIPSNYYSEVNLQMINPNVLIYIFSHYQHMEMTENVNVNANRNDYIAELIKQKFNSVNTDILPDFSLLSDLEAAYNNKFMYRLLTFACTTTSKDFCETPVFKKRT